MPVIMMIIILVVISVIVSVVIPIIVPVVIPLIVPVVIPVVIITRVAPFIAVASITAQRRIPARWIDGMAGRACVHRIMFVLML
jgi:hypothetical protein